MKTILVPSVLTDLMSVILLLLKIWKVNENSLIKCYDTCVYVWCQISTLMNLDYRGEYTAIFLTNGLCVVYHSLMQCLALVYPGWGQRSEFFASAFAAWYC